MTREKKIKVGAVDCTIDELLFDVELIDNPKMTNSEYAKIVVGHTINGEMDLNYCSPRYELVKNADIFPNIEQVLIDNGIEFEVHYSHIDFVRFYADYVITDKRYKYIMAGTNDMIMPVLRVQHSYNGLTKYRIVFGYYRVICSNGATIPVEEMKKFNLAIVGKHTESIKKSFHRLDETLKFFVFNAELITDSILVKYEILGRRWYTSFAEDEKRVTTVLEKNEIAMIDNNNFNTLNDIMSRISKEANHDGLGYNGRVNDWLIYNGINQYLNDDNRNIAVPEKRQEKDSRILEYMLENE